MRFCRSDKKGPRRKVIWSFLYSIKVKRRISYLGHQNTRTQLTALNVKGAACYLFVVSMGVYHRKLPPTMLVILTFQFPVVKGSVTGKKRAPCNSERISLKLKSKPVSPITVFSSYNQDSTTSFLDIHHYNRTKYLDC